MKKNLSILKGKASKKSDRAKEATEKVVQVNTVPPPARPSLTFVSPPLTSLRAQTLTYSFFQVLKRFGAKGEGDMDEGETEDSFSDFDDF
jgi:hypothetical protein